MGNLNGKSDAVTPDDIPFAQDYVGDQFLLRDGYIVGLLAETGEIEGVGSFKTV